MVGVINAAVWFGACIFFTFGAGPAFFSNEMLALLTRPYAGAAAMIVLQRYFLLNQICGVIALIHLVAESLYLGRPVMRWTLSVLAAVFILGLVGGYGIQPKLKTLHRSMYNPANPPALRQTAEHSFRFWHGVSQAVNLVVVAGVLVYLLRVTRVSDTSRYRS